MACPSDSGKALAQKKLGWRGKFPKRLDGLSREWTVFIPRDACDGLPLELKVSAVGLLNCIGPDLKINGGTPRDHHSNRGDRTFILRAVVPQPEKLPAKPKD